MDKQLETFPASDATGSELLIESGDATRKSSADASEQSRWMEAAKRGDLEAFSALFEKNRAKLYATAYLMLHRRQAAEDVVQETYTKAVQAIAGYRGEGSPVSWLMSIAVNLCRHQLRDSKRGAEGASEKALDSGQRLRRAASKGVVTKVIQTEAGRLLHIAMGFLTPGQQEVVALRYQDCLSYEEIGGILGMNAGAARALAHRAKATIREKMSVDFEPEGPVDDEDQDEGRDS